MFEEGPLVVGPGVDRFDLVSGSILVGYPGDEYVCTHEHRGGDECLSFHLAPALVEAVGYRPEIWQSVCVPPIPELMVVGELAQAVAEGSSEIGLDEVGMLLAARFVAIVSGRRRRPMDVRAMIAAAPSKQHFGSTQTRTSRSISRP